MSIAANPEPPTSPPNPTTLWPLTGRQGELSVLCDGLRAGLPAIVITGEAGIGKTRLAREGLSVLAAEGLSAEWTEASAEARSISLGALAHLLERRATSTADSDWDTLSSLQAGLAERGGTARMVLAVDDAHRLDDESASLVSNLARSGQPPVLLTVRSGETLPEELANLVGEAGALHAVELRDGLAVSYGIADSPADSNLFWQAGTVLALAETGLPYQFSRLLEPEDFGDGLTVPVASHVHRDPESWGPDPLWPHAGDRGVVALPAPGRVGRLGHDAALSAGRVGAHDLAARPRRHCQPHRLH